MCGDTVLVNILYLVRLRGVLLEFLAMSVGTEPHVYLDIISQMQEPYYKDSFSTGTSLYFHRTGRKSVAEV